MKGWLEIHLTIDAQEVGETWESYEDNLWRLRVWNFILFF